MICSGDVVTSDCFVGGGAQQLVDKRITRMLFHLRSAVRGAACRHAACRTHARLRRAPHAEEPRGALAAGRLVRLVVRPLLAFRASASTSSGYAADSAWRARGGARKGVRAVRARRALFGPRACVRACGTAGAFVAACSRETSRTTGVCGCVEVCMCVYVCEYVYAYEFRKQNHRLDDHYNYNYNYNY